MLTLTKEDMEALSINEQVLAKALGLDFSSSRRTRQSHVKCTSGDPYILITNTSCRLCNALHTRIFEMLKEGSFLHSREIAKIPSGKELGNMKVKSTALTVRYCWNCYSYLSNLTKEDLTMKFLSYIRDGRNFVT